MLQIIDSFPEMEALCANQAFDMGHWERYIKGVLPEVYQLCMDDMNWILATGQFTFEADYLPVLQLVFSHSDRRKQTHELFVQLTRGLEGKITQLFGRCPDVNLVFYLGLCNAAGWVTTINQRTHILLGIEKIMELQWDNPGDFLGLLYHELGHAHHMQYGRFSCDMADARRKFLWQLFSEGVALCYEQMLMGSAAYYHKDKNGWKAWCDEHFEQIMQDFTLDLPTMAFDTQRWFGDWVSYQGRGDVGYYLGCRFVQHILKSLSFDQTIKLDIQGIEQFYADFLKTG